MTVQYYQEVLSAGPVAFLKLLIKWRGGIFKLIYMDFIVFSSLYAIISCIYRIVLKNETKRQFENIVRYVSNSQSLIPVAFILGFYVSLVFGRFWTHFMTVPWITKVALLVACHIRGGPDEVEEKEARIQRRSIIRYLVAAQILTLNRVSVPVKRRYPQLSELCNTGILLEHEACIINNTEPFTVQPFIPITWCTAIVMHADTQGRITNESVLINIIKEINVFRQGLQELFLLDQMCVPLVYTQVVTLAVYTYFLSCLIGRQFIVNSSNSSRNNDFFVPIFTILQFIVYMGWLKLALTLVNPMGDDDEDFDLNNIVDYNLEVGLAIVDNLDDKQPQFTKDKFFDKKDFKLPMEGSMKDAKCKPFMGSVYDMKVENDSWITSMRSVVVDDGGDNKSLADDEIRRRSISRKGSYKTQYSSSNRKVSMNSLFHFNLIPVVSEEDSPAASDNENEPETGDLQDQKSPAFDVKPDKHSLVAIEEEEAVNTTSAAQDNLRQEGEGEPKVHQSKEEKTPRSKKLSAVAENEEEVPDKDVFGWGEEMRIPEELEKVEGNE